MIEDKKLRIRRAVAIVFFVEVLTNRGVRKPFPVMFL